MAFQSLKKLSIKKIEIERYNIKDYNKNDLDGYLKTIEKNIGLENLTLRDHFQKYSANYDNFVKSTIINLKWNSLIFSLYKKQLDVDEELIKSELNSELFALSSWLSVITGSEALLVILLASLYLAGNNTGWTVHSGKARGHLCPLFILTFLYIYENLRR